MKKVPFLPVKIGSAKKISKYFLGFGESLSHMFPSLDFNLHQSNIDFDSREWLGLGLFVSAIYAFVLFDAVFLLLLYVRGVFSFALGIGIVVALMTGASIFLYFSMYPKLIVGRKVKNIERNMPLALNHIFVQVRSGVTMFNAMNSVASEKYGKLSEEFGKAVTDINTGRSDMDALEKLAVNNPSLIFRRVIWQIVNALKSGADIGNTLKEIVDNITMEQKTAIKKYGSELNPLSLFYMMLVVIFPTLGVVFLLVLSSFIGAAISVHLLLIAILALLVVVQVMFVGLIKNKRPIGL